MFLLFWKIYVKEYLGQDFKKLHAGLAIEDLKYENNQQLICGIVLLARLDW